MLNLSIDAFQIDVSEMNEKRLMAKITHEISEFLHTFTKEDARIALNVPYVEDTDKMLAVFQEHVFDNLKEIAGPEEKTISSMIDSLETTSKMTMLEATEESK